MADKAFGGLAGIIQSKVMNGITGAVQGNIAGGLAKLDSKISKALGPTFGAAYGTTGNGNSWFDLSNGRPDPHLQIDWTIDLPDSFPSEYVEEVQAPMADFEVGAGIFRGGQRMYYADVQDISSLSLTFYGDNESKSLQYLQAWKDKVGVNGVINYPSQYKRNIVVKLTDMKGTVHAQFAYYGCWPSKIPTVGLISSNSGRTILPVDFAVDGVIVTFPAASGGLAGSLGLGRITDFINGAPAKFAGAIGGGLANAAGSAIGKLF
jgi:hypothetical protein